MSYMVHNIGIIMTFCIGYVCGLVIDRCAVVTYVSEQSAVDAVSSDVLHLHNR